MVATYYEYRYADYIFGNETEAKIFAKVRGWEVIMDQVFYTPVIFAFDDCVAD